MSTIREKFEAWATKYNLILGGANFVTGTAWAAWQAATEAAKAESQDDNKPAMYCVPDKDGKPLFGKGWMFSPIPHLAATMPLYIRPAAKATGTAELPPLPIYYGTSAMEAERAHKYATEYGQACFEAARQPAPVTMPPAAWAAESTTGGAMRMLTKISLLESEVDRYVNREDMARIGCGRVKVPLYRAAPLVDYTVLHEWANAKGVSYNELCAVVRAATNRSQP